jgi:hypothetical protein
MIAEPFSADREITAGNVWVLLTGFGLGPDLIRILNQWWRIAGLLLTNTNPRSRSDAFQQSRQRIFLQPNASRGRRKAVTGQMDEHGAASPGDTRAGVVVDLDNEVVEMVIAPEPVAGLVGPAAERTVVAPFSGVLAPGIVGPDRPDWKLRPRARVSVCPPPELPQLEQATRRSTIALAFVGPNTSTPQRNRDR